MKTSYAVLAFALFFSLALSSCSDQSPKASSTRDWNDFVVTDDAHLPAFVNGTNSSSCETKIKKVVCLVDPQPTSGSGRRTCLPGSERYQEPVLTIYRSLPPQFQRMFCTLKVIYIEKETVAIAYAGATNSPVPEIRSNFMGIRQAVLDNDLPLDLVLGWKEQKLFGATAPAFERDPALPIFKVKVDPSSSSSRPSDLKFSPLLTYVFLHEMGHLFDYNNGLTRFRCLNDSCSRTRLESSSWGAGPFASDGKINLKSELAVFRDQICFYECRTPALSPSDIRTFYSKLEASEFLTAYSAESPYENFAETTANYFLKTTYGTTTAVELEGTDIYDIGAKFDSEAFAKSRKAVEKFYRGKIKYGW